MSSNNSSSESQTPETLKSLASELFASYAREDEEVTKIQQKLELALESRSEAVKKIHAALGKGPFNFRGHQVLIICRDNKTTGKSTWFFKGPNKNKAVIDVD